MLVCRARWNQVIVDDFLCYAVVCGADNASVELLRLKALLRVREQHVNLVDSLQRVLDLIPSYNYTKFPTILSDEDSKPAYDAINWDRSTWPRRNASVPVPDVPVFPTAETTAAQVEAILSVFPLKAVSRRATAAEAMPGDDSTSAKKSSSSLSHTIRRMFGSFKRSGASNAWVVRDVCTGAFIVHCGHCDAVHH